MEYVSKGVERTIIEQSVRKTLCSFHIGSYGWCGKVVPILNPFKLKGIKSIKDDMHW